MSYVQLVWDDRGVWRTATTRAPQNHDQAIFWFPIADPSTFQIYVRLLERLARLHFGDRIVDSICGERHSTFREDAGSDYIIFQAIHDVPVALAMAPPQKQYRTEEGGRWKCGVVYRAGTDTSDPLVSDAVRAYHALGERFAEAMQGDARPEERLELISQAARQAMKDPVVVAMFRSVEPASSPLPSIMPKQETDGLSERSWSRSRRRPSSHADSRTRPLSRSRSPHRFHGEYLMRNNPGLQRIQAEDPIAWDDEVDQSTPVPWDTVGQRTISSPVPPPPPPGRPRVSSHDNPFIPSPVHLPQRTEPRDPYFYTRRH